MLDAVTKANPYRIIEVSGSSYERGEAYGETVKDSLDRFLQKEFYGPWPGKKEEMQRFGSRCFDMVKKRLPKTTEFIRGFSASTGLSVEEVAMIQAHEEMAYDRILSGLDFGNYHCTAFGVAPHETVTGKTYVGQTLDWYTSMNEFKQILRHKTENGLRILTYAFGGIWAIAGMNSAGVSLVCTSAGFEHVRKGGKARVGVPTDALMEEILEQESIKAAVDLVMRAENAGWFIFLLGSADGTLVKIEACPGEKACVYPKSFMVTAGGAYYSEKVRTLTKEETVLPRFEPKSARMAELLLAYSGQLSPELLLQFMASHDPNVSICGHGLQNATIDSYLFSPAENRCWFNPGPPCYYQAIELKI